jgi:pyruvate,water dikinase
MSWFQPLDQIAEAAPSAVGYNAYCLGQLKQHHLPVAEGWVLKCNLWQQILGQMLGVQSKPSLTLARSTACQGEELQHLSRTWQEILGIVLDEAAWLEADLVCPLPHWVMRSSLWIDSQNDRPIESLLPCHDLLADRIGTEESFSSTLQQFWADVFRAGNMMVWGRHCQTMTQLSLGSVLLPLYPAVASGRLTLISDTAHIEAIEGLVLPLTQGEAIPARCQVDLGHPDRVEWQPGHQERRYCLRPESAAEAKIYTAGGREARQKAVNHAPGRLHSVERSQENVTDVLDGGQISALLQLADQVRTVLTGVREPLKDTTAEPDGVTSRKPWDGVQSEWALSSTEAGKTPEWVITRALPWARKSPQASRQTVVVSSKSAPPRRSAPDPPPLPQVSVVVKGIGASSGRVQAVAIVARTPQDLPDPLPPGCVVVLPDLQPDRFLQLESVAGLVIEQGGATCHAAILAREMGIPAVVGAPQATQLIDSDLLLWMDGERGLVYGIAAGLSTQLLASPAPVIPPSASDAQEMETSPSVNLEAQPLPPLQTKVMINLSQSRRIPDLPNPAIDGIGLLRSEWLMLEILDRRHPWHWVDQGQGSELQTRLAQTLEPILQALGDKPVRYRSLDLRSHEWQSLEGSPPPDTNPMLGLRGALSYTLDSRLFEVELGALADLQRAGYRNLQLMLPFVRSVEEVIACRQYIDYARLTQGDGFALWIMAEVPSVLFLLPAYARAGVQGIAIGSNDLTQLLLAVDRDQRTMATAYDERHPVVQMALAHLIREAKRCGMTCSICGQAPVRYPELIDDLVAWGIDSISVEMGALAFTRAAVREAEGG